MSAGKKGLPVWAWILLAVPVLLVGLGIVSALASYGVRKYIVNAKEAEAKTGGLGSANEPAPPAASAVAVPPLAGAAVDLSTVMGRARKLANAWQREAALLGIEATLLDGKIQAQNGASAKLTFGPSAFDTTRARSGLFVVVYDQGGIHGAPVAGTAGKPLPEPMCAPERVLSRLTNSAEGPTTLRYGLDAAQRPMWMASSQAQPKEQRLFDPQDCRVRGLVGPRSKR